MSKKQIILSKAKVEFEQRAKEQGESIQFNICVPHCSDISCTSTTTTTTVVTPPHKKRRLEQSSMSTQEEEESSSVVDGCGAFNTHYSTQSSPPPLPSTNYTEDVKMNPLPAPKYLPRSQWPSFPSSVTPAYPESTSSTSSHTGTRIYHYHSNPAPVVVYPDSTQSYHHNHHSNTSLFMSTRSTETRLPSIISSEEPSSHMYTTDFSKSSSSNTTTTTTTTRDNEKPLSNIASFLQSVSQTAQSSPQLMKSCVNSVPQTIGVQSVIPVAFNSNCNNHVVPPTSNNTYFPSSSSHHTEHSTKRQTTPPPKTTRRRSSSAAQNSVASAQENVGQQVLCCLVGCTNPVTNRLRFSLRCHGEGDFKSEMISKGMNKVCHYHYFADLYQFKKATKGGVNSGLSKKSTPSPKKPSNSQLGKRGRRSTCDVFLSTTQQEEGSSTLPVTHNNSTKSTVVVSSASLVTSQRCSTTPVKTEDANIFFNFVELNRKSNQQQRTIL